MAETPNTRMQLSDRFFVVSGAGKVQPAWDVAMLNADLDTRDKCEITREEVIDRREIRDCRDQYFQDSKINTRLARWTLNYNEVTPQIIARWTALKEGTAAAPTGTPADEIQTLTRSGTVSGGTFTISLELEGRLVTTKPIAWNASNADIAAALTASRMRYIQPGDVTIGGTWGTAITITFPNTGRLGRANLPLLTVDDALLTGSTPAIVVAQTTPGEQNFHDLARSATKAKKYLSFALGWDEDIDRVEKYINHVVESVTVSASLDNQMTLQVVLVGEWEYDTIETAFSIPECVNIDALQTTDCRIEIDSQWESTDINSVTATIADNVPVDRLSAFGFDSVDVQTLRRGNQPADTLQMSVFGSQTDHVYELAQNERTQSPVPVRLHFGMPGDRATWYFPKTKLRFQTNREGFVGDGQYSIINLEGVPFRDGANVPFDSEAYLDQGTAFLLASV